MVLDALYTKHGRSIFGTDEESFIKLSNVNVLVGPNNVGKSQTLTDIRDLMLADEPRHDEADTTIINSLTFSDDHSFDDVVDRLPINIDKENGEVHIVGQESSVNMSIDNWNRLTTNTVNKSTAGLRESISPAKVFYLNAQSRLQIATSTKNNGNRNNPESIMESLFFQNNSVMADLRDAFRRTFGQDIIFDYSKGSSLQFLVGEDIGSPPKQPAELGEFIMDNNLSPLDDEGDGYLSFVGVVVSILLSKGKVLLLDEPAAFLHPPQSRILGNWIAERARRVPGQLIIATHNGDLLSGLLETGDDIRIYRLNRPNMETTFHEMPPRTTRKLSEDPLLSSQRVIRSVFHEGAVVCEGGVDRTIYHSVAISEYDQRDVLFIDALGKHSVNNVMSPLVAADIPVATILDFDILNDHDIFKNVLKSSPYVDDYSDIEHLLNKREMIDEWFTKKKEWKEGINALCGPKIDKAKELIDDSADYGIFIVPNGEVEDWMDPALGSDHWTVAALREIQEGNCDNELNDFIGSVLEYIQEEYERIHNSSEPDSTSDNPFGTEE